jgi:hypothetical protein
MAKQYVCAECHGPVEMKGEGLKTSTCRKHPFRMVTVERDFSAGKEADRGSRKTPVQVRRHTQVKVVRTTERKAE